MTGAACQRHGREPGGGPGRYPTSGTREKEQCTKKQDIWLKSSVEARGGYLDRPVLVVLCVSTIVAALAMGVVWLGVAMLGSGAV